MSSHFTFEGTLFLRRKFKIETVAKSYEHAADYVQDQIEDLDTMEAFFIGEPKVDEAEIDSYEEVELSQNITIGRDY